jgi:hypothetical protein|tara:strand:- start:350 stop:922 length:573 start_codon:yes stop_codon:yes gene_type:complete
MAEINFHPGDKVMSTFELVKEMGRIILVLSIFEVMFYFAYLSEESYLPLVCGIPLGLILVAMVWQSLMHVFGFGKMVKNGNEIVLRTSRSGKRRSSIFDSIGRIFSAPMARLAMREADKDGDGKLSLDELVEQFDVESKSEYEELRNDFEKFDEDGDGFISLRELESMITHSDDDWAEKKTSNWWTNDDD